MTKESKERDEGGEYEPNSAQLLAATTQDHFAARNYQAAAEKLKKLTGMKEGDKKVLHNDALNSFFVDGGRDAKAVLDALNEVEAQFLDQASWQQSSEWQAEAAAAGNDDNEGGGLSYAEDFDGSILQYNIVVLLDTSKQYADATELAEKLYHRLEPVDENLACKLCFVLLDLYLKNGQPEKASQVITYIEKSFTTLMNASVTKDKDGKDKNSDSKYAVGTELPVGGLAAPPPREHVFGVPHQPDPAPDLKFLLNLFKARLYMQTESLKSAKREIKSALNTSSQHPAALFLKSSLEYSRQNYKKAIKLLNSAYKTAEDPSIRALYLNNLGCIHARVRNYNSAMFYFSKSLKDNDSLFREKVEASHKAGGTAQYSVAGFTCDRRPDMMYNLGLQLLLTGKPEKAFSAFQHAAVQYYSSPRLWIRLAECCIGTHVQKLESSISANKTDIVKSVTTSGRRRRITVSSSSSSRDCGLAVTPTDDSAVEAPANGKRAAAKPLPAMTLEYGARCLKTALNLISRLSSEAAAAVASNDAALDEQDTDSQTNCSDTNVNGAPTTKAKVEQFDHLRNFALVSLAFISLAVEDFVTAYVHAEAVLADGNVCLDAHKFLAHIYAAEARCFMGNTAVAQEHLNPALLSNLRPPVPASDEEQPPARGPSPYTTIDLQSPGNAASHAILLTNLATIRILQNDVVQARQCLNQALTIWPNYGTALLSLAYIEAREGNAQNASSLLVCRRPTPLQTPVQPQQQAAKGKNILKSLR